MLYSIIIPMYNLDKYIEVTLDSILKNDLSECELILLDDGSKDRTVDVAETLLKAKCTCDYKILKKENTGVSDTRNQGIECAKGKYIIFCDGDDLFEPELLETVRKELAPNVDMVCWPFYILHGTDKTVSQKATVNTIFSTEQMLRLHLLESYKVRLGSFAIKKELLLERKVYFSKECTFAEDIEFIMKCILNAHTIQWISTPLFCYIKREGSLINSYNIRRFEAPKAIERVNIYLEENDIVLQNNLVEYMKNSLYVLHYIYSIEACLQYISSQKEGRQLYKEILDQYPDIEKACRKKIAKMSKYPVGMSVSRVRLLKLGTLLYIQIRLFVKKRKES